MRYYYLIGLSVLSLLCSCSTETCESWYNEHEMNNSYSGIVRRKYTGSRGRSFMEISDQSFEGKEYYVHNTNMFDAMDSGDYVYKNKGTLKAYLVKGNDTLYYYPQCGMHEVRFGD